MFSALKKLARGAEDRGSGAPTPMPSSLQKKFSRGVHYNMKILIKGDRNVGKSCLLQRLQGGPFIEEYAPTEEIQAAAIHWTYKDSDHIVKVDVWEVVDKATKRKAPLGLKLDNASTVGTGAVDDIPALDATFLDVYKDASGVILMMDITKPWTFDYAVKELDRIPADLPLVLLGNHCDMHHHRQLHTHHIEHALAQARHTRTAPVRYAESSMRNGFGLRFLHKFFGVPFLRLQRAALLQQLQRNQRDAQDAELELTDFQNSEESDYTTFVERLAHKRRAGSREPQPPLVGRSPSIVLGAGKPILPPNANPLMSQSLSSPVTVRALTEPPPRQTEYVNAELLTPTDHSNAGVGAPAAGSGELDEFFAGALDSTFLEDAALQQQHSPSNDDSDNSDNDNAVNPMVASALDDEDFDIPQPRTNEPDIYRPKGRTQSALPKTDVSDTAKTRVGFVDKYKTEPKNCRGQERRGSEEIQQLMSDMKVGGVEESDPAQFELWAGAARRSPEGGEDPDKSTEPQSLKEEKKKHKKKKSKDGSSEERKEKKHKHKKSKSDRESKQHGLLLPPELEQGARDQYDSL